MPTSYMQNLPIPDISAAHASPPILHFGVLTWLQVGNENSAQSPGQSFWKSIGVADVRGFGSVDIRAEMLIFQGFRER